MRYFLIIICLLLFSGKSLRSQAVFAPTTQDGIYELLGELAGDRIIEVNDVVKPWTRAYIAGKLQEAIERKDQLSLRQLKEIEFYMNDYRLELVCHTKDISPLNLFPGHEHLATSPDPLSVMYRDSLFAFCLRPSLGLEAIARGWRPEVATRLGAEGFGYYSNHWGVYGGYSYNYESTALTGPDYLDPRPGARTHTFSDGSLDFHDYRWGITYANRMMMVGVLHDRPQWGSGYHGSNILSGHAPAFTQIMLQLKPARWFEFNYIHGWLGSGVVDSSRSYWDGETYEEVMRPKYIAANLFTISPVQRLRLSVGSSTIYSDMGIQAAYLVPFIFFRAADYELSGMSDDASANSQMFFDISSRNIRHLHLYFSLFVDEFSMYRVGKSNEHNFLSYKGGFRLSNWPLEHASFTAGYTYTLPAVYQHYISTTTFESEQYVLGNYMRDNACELWLAVAYKPLRGLRVELSYNFARHGNDAAYDGITPADEIPMLQDITWQKSIIALRADYAVLTNASLFAAMQYGNIRGYDADGQPAAYYLDKFTPEIYHGETFSFTMGARMGF